MRQRLMYTMDITNHAVARYCERIRPVPVDKARAEIKLCLAAAKPHHLERLKRRKNRRTIMVPTGCCLFVFAKGGAMVTVLPRDGNE